MNPITSARETHDSSNYGCPTVPSRLARELEEDRAALYHALKAVRDGYEGLETNPECDCDDCEFLLPIDAALSLAESRSYHKETP